MRQIVLEVKYGERRKGIGFPCTEQDLQEAMKDLDGTLVLAGKAKGKMSGGG